MGLHVLHRAAIARKPDHSEPDQHHCPYGGLGDSADLFIPDSASGVRCRNVTYNVEIKGGLVKAAEEPAAQPGLLSPHPTCPALPCKLQDTIEPSDKVKFPESPEV
jgi:hypothetical protein